MAGPFGYSSENPGPEIERQTDITAALSGAGEVTVGTGAMQQILETHVRAHLAELAEPEFRL